MTRSKRLGIMSEGELLRHRETLTVLGLCAACVLASVVIVTTVANALALETDMLTSPLPGDVPASAAPHGGAGLAGQTESSGWRTTKATFYGDPYDDGRRRICADGKTVYRSDGMFCATRLVPLGTIIEIRRGNVTLRLKVADTQAKRYGHLIDLPTKTWDRFGAKRSVGVLPVEWRIAK